MLAQIKRSDCGKLERILERSSLGARCRSRGPASMVARYLKSDGRRRTRRRRLRTLKAAYSGWRIPSLLPQDCVPFRSSSHRPRRALAVFQIETDLCNNVAVLIPCRRHTSAVFSPASGSLIIPMICASVNWLFRGFSSLSTFVGSTR